MNPDKVLGIQDDKTQFRKALEHTINCHNMESGSNTPDFVLAQFLDASLMALDRAVQRRESYYNPGGTNETTVKDGPLTEGQRQTFEAAARPLIAWMAENLTPHTRVMVDSTSAEIVQGQYLLKTVEYLRD
jgi:hypothetical protein